VREILKGIIPDDGNIALRLSFIDNKTPEYSDSVSDDVRRITLFSSETAKSLTKEQINNDLKYDTGFLSFDAEDMTEEDVVSLIVFAMIMKIDEEKANVRKTLDDMRLRRTLFRRLPPDSILESMHTLPIDIEQRLEAVKAISNQYPVILKRLIESISRAANLAKYIESSA
jgi:hypothetical protein